MFLAFSDYDLLSTLRTDAPNYGVNAMLDGRSTSSRRLHAGPRWKWSATPSTMMMCSFWNLAADSASTTLPLPWLRLLAPWARSQQLSLTPTAPTLLGSDRSAVGRIAFPRTWRQNWGYFYPWDVTRFHHVTPGGAPIDHPMTWSAQPSVPTQAAGDDFWAN